MQVWRHVAAERAASQTLDLQVPGGTEWEFQDELKLSHVTDNKQDWSGLITSHLFDSCKDYLL